MGAERARGVHAQLRVFHHRTNLVTAYRGGAGAWIDWIGIGESSLQLTLLP
jgi:hypothetical protein